MAMITFDFDETLTKPIWNEKQQTFEQSDNPNHEVIAKMKDFHRQGKQIAIVTSRFKEQKVAEFIQRYNLPVSSIHFTAGKIKARTLKNLNCELHFDDSEDEAIASQELNIKTILVSYRYDQINNSVVCDFKD